MSVFGMKEFIGKYIFTVEEHDSDLKLELFHTDTYDRTSIRLNEKTVRDLVKICEIYLEKRKGAKE